MDIHVSMQCAVVLAVMDQNSYSPEFDPILLPPGPRLEDHVWVLTVHISDTFGATTVVILRAKIGQNDCV